MTEQTSRLAIVIDSTGAEKQADSLSTALDKMTGSGKEATKAVSDTGKAADSAAKSVTKKARATEDESNALTDLLAKIRPTNTALAELDKLSRQLNSAFNKGFINENQFVTYATILDGIVMKTEKLDDELTGAAAAQREVAKTAQEAAAQAEAQSRALSQLEARLSPVTSALKSLDDQQRQVAEFAKSGAISTAQYDAYIAKIEEFRREVNGEAEAERNAAKAKQEHAAAINKLESSLDPVTASLKRLDEQQKQVNASLKAGDINASQYETYSQSISRARSEVTGEAQAARDAAKAHDEQKASLQRLIAQIDPASEALKRLDAQQQQLAQAKAKGLLDADTYDSLSMRLVTMREEMDKARVQMDKGAISAGQYKQAMRQLPAQFTDIFTSIAGGMPLWLIFTQQGGQIADSFGGWSSLLDVIKREVLGFSDATDESSDSLSDNANGLAENADHLKQFSGLLTPTGLAVAALAATVGLLTYSYYKGSQEQDAFNESLILTGNIVGKTSGQLADMSRAVANSAGSTVSMSSDVLNQLVASGKVAESSLTSASEAIIKLNDATGIATSKLVSDFEAIGNNPVEAIKKLTDQYHFLDLATYNQIRALQEQGNQQEAARIASDAYSAAIGQKADEIKSRLGPLRTAWNDLGDAAKGAWDKMWDFGRETSIEEKIAQKQGQMGVLLKRMPNEKEIIGILQGEINSLVMLKDMQDEKTGARAGAIKADEKAINAQRELNQLAEQTASNERKRAKEREKLNRLISDGAKIEKIGSETDDQAKQRLLKAIDDKYKDPVTPKVKAYTEDAGRRILNQINEQNAAFEAQLVASDKLSTSAQQRIKFEQQIKDIQQRQAKGLPVTKEQQSLVAMSKEIGLAYERLELSQGAAKTLDDYRKMQEAILPKELKQNETLKERLDILQKMVALKKLTPEAAGQQASNLISKTVLPDSVISGVNRAGGTLTSGATNSDLSGQGLNMIGLKVDPQLETLNKLKQAQTEYAEWLNQQQQAITQSTLLNEQQKQDQLLSLYQTGAQNQQAISTAVSVAEMQVAQNAFSSITDSMGTMFGEQSSMYKAAFATQKAFAIAQAALQLPMAMGQALAGLPFPANLAAIAQVVGLMSTITSSISSVALTGMAHSGIDSVPSTGTWLLEKGERVMTSQTSAKLDATLENLRKNGMDATLSKPGFGTGAQNVSNNSQQTTVISPQINLPPVTINGNPSDATIQLVQQAARTGAEQGYRKVVDDIATGRGEAHKALVGGYNTSRRTG